MEIRAIQGHSGGATNMEAMGYTRFHADTIPWIYHCCPRSALEGITQFGLIPGG